MNHKKSSVYQSIRSMYYGLKHLPENIRLKVQELKLKKFKDSHKGESCFVIGNGPSLRLEDLEKLEQKGYKSFASNRIYLIFPQTTWRPDYYFMSDTKLLAQFNNEMNEIPYGNRFFPEQHKKELKRGSFYHTVPFDYKHEGKFSKDAGKGVCQACTVTSEMIQFAYFMGFQNIYLIGVDFSYQMNHKNSDGTYKYQGEQNYFIPNYLKKGEVADMPDVQANLLGFGAARKAIEEEGRVIRNATRGGKLEVFERIDIDKLLEKEGC